MSYDLMVLDKHKRFEKKYIGLTCEQYAGDEGLGDEYRS